MITKGKTNRTFFTNQNVQCVVCTYLACVSADKDTTWSQIRHSFFFSFACNMIIENQIRKQLAEELAYRFFINSIWRLELLLSLNCRQLYIKCCQLICSTKAAFLQPDDARIKMFNNTSEGKDFRAKQEGNNNEPTLPKYTSTSRQWAGFKNPRIVRVSKAFGGKDRHSKVCTVKGLRDRRIRLSVPTAIQLYDLQDRLGLNQPSKVIDWLIDSTKDDIDKLPPLQMLPSDFNQFHPVPSTLLPQDLNSPQISFSQFLSTTPDATFVKDVGNRTLLYTKQGIKLDNDHDHIDGGHQRMKGKEALVENKWNEQENGGLNFFPIPQYSYPGLFPYNPYYNWEQPSSNVSISQLGNQGLVSSQTDSSMVLPSASQFFLHPPTAITPSPFPPYLMPNLGQNNHSHFLSSSSQHVPPNPIMPQLNLSDSQEKVPFDLDGQHKVRSQNNDDN